MSVPYLVLAIVTLISTVPSLYFSAAEIRSDDPAVRRVAWYTTARSAALFVLAVVALCGRFDGWLLAIAVAMIIVQAADGVIALRGGKAVMYIGPFATAAVTAAALVWFVTAG
ncbi:hypothetical protein GCM10025768_23230 [Microbacterium pseudoresistens]|uniref:Uncharacterized protein n=1 Tax=Microbacterium pseudoresistens TaxID=640634 RepID=A0A7Y9JMK0_9MICO|nr:hypothetical protein [Microbacterium pseudoresistens]NYD53618.1 hypothetical protein [Microbacterium pseudoresistens]